MSMMVIASWKRSRPHRERQPISVLLRVVTKATLARPYPVEMALAIPSRRNPAISSDSSRHVAAVAVKSVPDFRTACPRTSRPASITATLVRDDPMSRPTNTGFDMLVHRLANILAFDRRCIRSSFVALLHRTPRYASVARLTGAAHRRSRCFKIFARRYTLSGLPTSRGASR